MTKKFKLITSLTILLIFFSIIHGSFAIDNQTLDTNTVNSISDEDNSHTYQDTSPNKDLIGENSLTNSKSSSNNINTKSNIYIDKSIIDNDTIPQENYNIKNKENNLLKSEDEINKINSNSDLKDNNTTNIISTEIQNTLKDSSDNPLPSKYDLRDYGYVTDVKNQGDRGTCWSFTALSVLESCILKANGTIYDFSENNLINYIKHSDYGLKDNSDAGNTMNALAYLLSWLGPINDTEDPYDSTKTYIQSDSLIHIQNVLFIELDNKLDLNPIKEAIMKYGAVGTTLYWNTTNYLKGTNYYNYENTETNHAITIVGWDDTYSRYNFDKTPTGNGAWIVKNSHGTNIGDNGYFHVSYYDKSINYIDNSIKVYTFILNDTTKYYKNYQYDYAGATANLPVDEGKLWIKNVYTARENEYLAAVSTYFLQEVNYELEIYVNNKKQYTQSSKSKTGYYTIKLNKMIPLKTNDQFSIVYKLTTTDSSALLIAVCDSDNLKKDYLKSEISFESANNLKWYDTYTYGEVGFCNCIKAYTILNPINTEIQLDIANRIDDTADLIATVHDQYGFLVNSGNVTFKIGDKTQVIQIKNGIATLKNTILTTGTINAEFKSIGYATSTISKLISNPLINTKLNLIISSEHNPTNITAYITDLGHNPVTNGFVTFTTDTEIYTVDVIDGFANLTNIILNIGENHITAKYQELFYYNSTENNTSINISLIKSKIELIVTSEENPYEIIAKVSDSENNPINIGSITFNLPTNTSTVNVTNGIAKITHLFTKIGINNITAQYNRNFRYDASDMNKSINVTKKEVKLNLKIETNKNEVTLTTNIDNCLMEYDILIEINGQKYGPLHSENGNTIFNMKNMDDGDYKYTISLNSAIYKANNLTDEFKIKALKTKIIAPDARIYKNEDYSVILKDKYDVPIPNKWVYIRIGTKYYKTETNDQGTAIFPLNLDTNTYTAILEFQGDNDYLKSNTTARVTIQDNPNQDTTSQTNTILILENKDMTTYYNSGDQYQVRIYDYYGNPVGIGQTVNFKINNKNYFVKTDQNGYAKVKITQKPGKYTIITTYNDYSVKNKLTIKTTIITKNINVKQGKTIIFKAKILNNKGKSVKNKKVTFKIKGKSYKIKTNKKGIATLKINKKFKTGKYAIKTSYGKLTVSNKITIKK